MVKNAIMKSKENNMAINKKTGKVYASSQKANMKYHKTHLRQIKFGFHITLDADILAKLDSVPNKQGYVKDLIRADIAKEKATD